MTYGNAVLSVIGGGGGRLLICVESQDLCTLIVHDFQCLPLAFIANILEPLYTSFLYFQFFFYHFC